MNSTQSLGLLIPIAYLIGSIPFGLLVGKARGIDVRTAGSGNIGATNVGRLLGGKFFALVFTLDVLKGLAPMLIAGTILHGQPHSQMTYLLWLLVGFASILGHMFSLFLKFKGGKGVATSTGVILGLYPYYTLPAVVAIVIFVAAFLLTRYVSVGSILGSAGFAVAYFVIGTIQKWDVTGQQLPLLAFAVLVAVLIILKHRTNISRLMAGTEHKFTRK
jgi:glycerol-3-phosphate acyltransferase PlsY